MTWGADERAPEHAVVLGASGLLGHVVVDSLRRGIPHITGVLRRSQLELVWWPGFRDHRDHVSLIDGVDVAQWESLSELLDRLRPDVIVNCVGLTPRRPGSSDPIEMIRVNSLLPHLLANWAADAGCRLITISTDCVFGHEPGGFTETDATSGVDLYGRSKALGEVYDGDVVTIRTSFIGRELVGCTELLEWFLSNAGGQVFGYGDVWYSGVPVDMVASVVLMLATTHRHLRGLYHLASPDPISKHDLLVLANHAFDTDVTIVADPSRSSHRTLDGRQLGALLPIAAVRWDEALAAMAADRRYDLRPATLDGLPARRAAGGREEPR